MLAQNTATALGLWIKDVLVQGFGTAEIHLTMRSGEKALQLCLTALKDFKSVFDSLLQKAQPGSANI